MSRQLFLSSGDVRPPARWCEAFAEGLCGDDDTLRRMAGNADLIWLATAHDDWGARLAALAQALPACKIAVLSMTPDTQEALVALERGARAYCHALSVPELFREIALVVGHGGLWVGPELMTKVVGAARRALPATVGAQMPGCLSAREGEVARAVAAGLSNKEIADLLGITERTVKAHLGTTFEKLGVRDRLQLALRLSARAPLAQPD